MKLQPGAETLPNPHPKLKKIALQLLGAKALGVASLRRITALDDYGWYQSIKKGFPCDASGNPIPWLSYPAISLLAARANPEWNIFEFGAGYSTLWWAARCSLVTSCEHDATWCKRLTSRLPTNATLLHRSDENLYDTASTLTGSTYDVIVVDGILRSQCAVNSLTALKEDGVIVWDDTERESYGPGIEAIRKAGFKRLDLVGMSPLVIGLKQTTILYRANNVLDL